MYSTNGFETGVIYREDNLERLRRLPSESVDLVYLDPPFFSNRTYEVIWGDEAEVRSFRDRWKGGVNLYADWMRKRVVEMRRVLKAWCYNVGGKSTKRWARKHDTILFYSKGSTWYFDGKAVGIPRDTGDKSFGGKMGVDGDGRRYQDKLDRKSGKYYRYYLDEPKIPEDWWVINSIQSQSKERLGYPTQKPEALLERIIKASSRKGDVVLDPFCGCGTTIAVAQTLDRRWIGVDISLTAAEIMKARVEKLGAKNVRIVNEPGNEVELRWLKPFEFQNWVIRKVGGIHSPRKTGDMGIDGFTPIEQSPIQIKRSSKVGRPVIDNFETAVERYGADKGYVVAFSFTKGAYDEAARVKAAKGLEIELVTAKELLLGTSDLVAPVLNRQVLELPIEERPMPKAPPKNALPPKEVLFESEEHSEEVA